jgi:hypothetical protein
MTSPDAKSDSRGDRPLFRLGGAMAVSAAVISFVGNALHPRSTEYYGNPAAWLNHNTLSDIWFTSHVMMVLGSILFVGAFVALTRSFAGSRGQGLANVALAHALVGSALYLVTLALDGLVVPKLAGVWKVDAVPSPDAVFAGSIFYHTIFSLLYMLMLTLFGLAPVLYAVAMLFGTVYARWLGWAGVLSGSSVVLTGLLSMLGIATEFLDAVVWPVVASLVVLWFLVLGVLLWRRASSWQPA